MPSPRVTGGARLGVHRVWRVCNSLSSQARAKGRAREGLIR
jgi:hypothetical protein